MTIPRSAALLALCPLVGATAVPAAGVAAASPVPAHRPPHHRHGLPLGRADLVETRTSTEVAPGVTRTTITRGRADGSSRWVVEINIPSDASSPDPDAPARSVQEEGAARVAAARLTAAGLPAQAQPVNQVGAADVRDGVIGYRVRLTERFADKAASDAAAAKAKAAGFGGRSWYEGWDGGTASSGPWVVETVTIDPRTFRGGLAGTFGPDLEKRETPTELARLTGADVAINAGFFVMDPAAGAEGDPAGLAAYGGRVVSEAVTGRPVITLHRDGRATSITRPRWHGTLRTAAGRFALDGIDRVPGLIRNCGGRGDSPTDLPRHDVTCTDANELVAFTRDFGATTPAGPGAEVVLDHRGRVVSVRAHRGTALLRGQTSVQATGDLTGVLTRLRRGARVATTQEVTTSTGAPLHLDRGASIINGGPLLVRAGRTHVTQKQDGMNQAAVGNPSFDYGWVLQRNPRTFAGTDARGRTMLVTVDGRQPDRLGLSIPETAAVAQALGLREAMNLDGGGSTAMVLDGALVTKPSDATGERPVGDAIVVLPRR